MTLKNIINDICEYAVKNDLCNTSMGGLSLYDINFKQDNLYSLIFVAPSQNHNVTNNTIDYNFRLYYLDRLTRTNENNLDIFNASVLNLSKLINIIKEFNGVLKINNDYQIVNFADTQRLTDNVAGSYVDITVTVLNTNGICASDAILPTINVIKINYQNKDINITENGDYNVTYDNGYNALKEVNVNVNIDTDSYYNDGFNNGKIEGYNEGYEQGDINGREQQKSLLEAIKITENGVFDNENGYDEVTVEIDTQSYYDNGYNNGIEQGKEEQKSLLTSITITDNGNYTNENGYDEVIVNVGGDIKPKVPNGISLEGSTFTTIDMGRQDWSNVYDWSNMFLNCTNLTEIQNFPTDIEILCAYNMFANCRELTNIPNLNLSNCVSTKGLFYYLGKITSVPSMNLSNVLNAEEMFGGCTSLTSLPEIDFTNIVNANDMFNNCVNLVHDFNINAPNLHRAERMFAQCKKLTNINFSNTNNIKDAESMFYDCENLESVNGLNFENATNLKSCFDKCNKLIYIDDLKTSNVTNFYFIFNGCNLLKKVKINITKAENMQAMFGGCYDLEEIYFEGNPSYSNIYLRDVFYRAGENIDEPIMYYPQEFQTNYQQIINMLPSKWTAIPY